MTATTAPTSPGRRGFTLVEILVAMALIIFIMVILTEAFSAGTGVFRTLKAQGDMQEKLRAVTGLLRDDLRQAPGRQLHFGDGDGTLGTLGINGNPPAPTKGYFYIQQPPQPPNLCPPASIPVQGSLPEGVDGYGVASVRMNSPTLQLTAGNQLVIAGTPPAALLPALCFTVNRRGTQPQDYFAARIPGPTATNGLQPFGLSEQSFFTALKPGPVDYQLPVPLLGTPPQNAAALTQTPLPLRPPGGQQTGFLISQWAEIGYFLVPTGNFAGTKVIQGVPTSIPTYSLRRRLRVVISDQNLAAGLNTGTDPITKAAVQRIPANLWGGRYAEVSCLPDSSTSTSNPPVLYFNTPADLINPPQPTIAPNLPPCGLPLAANLPPTGCQVLVPPLNPNSAPPFQPQPLQQSLVPLASFPPPTAQQQGQNDWGGDDIVLTDVISFNVRVLALSLKTGQYSNDFLDLTDPALNQPVPGFYNTGFFNPNSPPQFTISALEITIRVWDTKTNQTRQVTLVQDM